MTEPTRRALLTGIAALSVAGTASTAQEGRAPKSFDFEEVERRAEELAKVAYDARVPPLPAPIAKLDYDAWRDIRFKPDKAFLGGENSPFRLQLFHVGFLYNRPVTVNLVRRGIATPIAYQSSLFDMGTDEARQAAAGRSRLRWSPLPQLPQQAEPARRTHRVSRRQLLPLPWTRSAVWPIRPWARPQRRGGGRSGGIPGLSANSG